ncbi:HYR domain-containing protein, partial [Tenacibaculum caenipelagi]|uniref:HYR domain-containing protein n=1 Tax=Tenacibaculum caenipelagi TaxID=1325435 RepID=UPI0014150843
AGIHEITLYGTCSETVSTTVEIKQLEELAIANAVPIDICFGAGDSTGKINLEWNGSVNFIGIQSTYPNGGTGSRSINQGLDNGYTTIDNFPVGMHEITLYGTCSETVSTTVEIKQLESTLICPTDATRSTDPGSCNYEIQGTEFDPTFGNDCGVSSIINDFNNASSLNGASVSDGTTITWTITYNAGNTETCSFTITVEDNEPPIIICPGKATRDVNHDSCNYRVQGTEFDPAYLDMDDNCTVNLIVTNNYNNSDTLADELLPTGKNKITWTVTDASGNQTSCTTTITILEDVAPTAICKNATVYLDANGMTTIDKNDIDNGSYDNCSGDLTFAFDVSTFDCSNVGDNIVTMFVADVSGNSTTCETTVTVIDNMAPTPDVTPLPVATAKLHVTVTPPTATDNCAGAVTATTTDPLTYDTPGNYTINWTYTDSYGNSSSQTQNVTVEEESSDATIKSVTIGNTDYTDPQNTIYYLIDCDNTDDSIEISIVTEAFATITPSHNFSVTIPKAGIYIQTVTVTSEDQSNTIEYTIVIEKRFDFSEIVIQKFDNVLLANNNSATNGGYKFVAYEWYRNGQVVGTNQYYSVGDNVTDLLNPSDNYSLKVTTADGDVIQTCTFNVELKYTNQANLYPNPAQKGNAITVNVDLAQEELKQMQISVYSLSGKLIKQVQSSSRSTIIPLSEKLASATYIVRIQTPNYNKTLKLIVAN